MEKTKVSFGAMQIVSVLLMVLSPLLLTGCMSIHEAARMGNAAEVEKQLAWGVNPNSKTFRYRTAPLHEAAANGKLRIVKLLLEKGANVNVTNEGGETPLHYAAKHGYLEVMEILLENGADPAQKGTGCGTPMQWARRNRQIQSIKMLLDHDVSINQRGSGGRTALMEAVSAEQLEIVNFLVANGADVNVTDERGEGCSPLCIAAHHNNLEIGRILLKHGADPALECEDRKIPEDFLIKIRKRN